MDSKFCGSKIIVFVNLKNSKKNPLICTTDIELAISILVKKNWNPQSYTFSNWKNYSLY